MDSYIERIPYGNQLSLELDDRSKSGRQRPWKKHKESNLHLYNVLRHIKEYDKAHIIADCAENLVFAECPGGHGRWLKKAYFCKDRLCFICIWRKSLFTYHQFIQVAHKAQEIIPGIKFIFITLTVENCQLADLGNTISHLSKSFTKLLRQPRPKKAYLGAFRSVEATYNPLTNTFHPHIHAVVAVPKSYFSGSYFISQADLTKMWQKAAGLTYKPICWIEKVKARKKNMPTVAEDIINMDNSLYESHRHGDNFPLTNAAAEVAKYATKVGDIINPQIKPNDSKEMVRAKLQLREDIDLQGTVLGYLIDGLHRKRLVSYSGLFKEAAKLLNCQDVEKADLIHVQGEEDHCQCPICQSELVNIQYKWENGLYLNKGTVTQTNKPIYHKQTNRQTGGNQ
jgi:plasmid rolling circle replication initiator protein Rep